jgi:integrase/recombinase XerD
MQQLMHASNYSPKSIKAYIIEARYFLSYYPLKDPLTFEQSDVLGYLQWLQLNYRCSWTKIHLCCCGCKFLFRKVLCKPLSLSFALYPRREHKLPVVMSQQEVQTLFAKVCGLKHRLMLKVIYSAGLRLSELQQLRIEDIDSKHMRIRIRHGKGNKERYTLLSQPLLDELRHYYKSYRPQIYLFNGQQKGKPVSERNIQWIMDRACKQAAFNTHYSIHTLRHSFATHLLESGVDLSTIQKLMGHSSIRSTSVYLHVQSNRIKTIPNPIDWMYETGNPSK